MYDVCRVMKLTKTEKYVADKINLDERFRAR